MKTKSQNKRKRVQIIHFKNIFQYTLNWVLKNQVTRSVQMSTENQKGIVKEVLTEI